MEDTMFGVSVNLTLEIGRLSRSQSTEELIKPLRDESSQRIAKILGTPEEPIAADQEDFVSKLRKGNLYDEILKLIGEKQ